MTEAQVTMRNGIRKITTESMEAARKKLEKRYESEMGKVMHALKSLPEAARSLQIKLLLDGESGELAAALLLHWLDPSCQVCHGTGLQPKRTSSICGKCQEHPGLAPLPHGGVGANYIKLMERCAAQASRDVRASCKS